MTSAAHKVLVNIAHVAQEINARFQLGCLPMVSPKMTSPKEGIKLHRFAGIFPEQFLTEAGRHREAVMAADQRMVIRCFGDDLADFVHDAFHVRGSNPTTPGLVGDTAAPSATSRTSPSFIDDKGCFPFGPTRAVPALGRRLQATP